MNINNDQLIIENKRILIVDDNTSIHEDIKKILLPDDSIDEELSNIKNILLEKKDDSKINDSEKIEYEIDDAYQGDEAIEMAYAADKNNQPYALIFMDVRMPPGIDGITTVFEIWKKIPLTEIIICTAYSDYSWNEIINKIGSTDRLLFLKKPFNSVEIKQMTLSLIKKWNLNKQIRYQINNLEDEVAQRTSQLQELLNEFESRVKQKTQLIVSMFNFANELNSYNTLEEVLDCIINAIADFTQSGRISIMLLDKDKKHLVIRKSIGIHPEVNHKVKIGEGIAGNVYKSGKKIIINDIISKGIEKKYSDYDAFISSPLICTPLLGPKTNLGVINVTNKKDNEPYTDEDIEIISYITYTASVAINNQLNELSLEENYIGIIKALATAIEAKDIYTRGHSDRVAKYSTEIAKRLNLPDEQIKTIEFAGILHDIGKIGVPEYILNKPGRLENEEFNKIKEHPEIGEGILKDIQFLEDVREIVRHHHERINGSGYPDGLKKNDISIGSKILGVADSFDAMNSDRIYRTKLPIEEIKKELMKNSGDFLDTDCVNALLDYLKDILYHTDDNEAIKEIIQEA